MTAGHKHQRSETSNQYTSSMEYSIASYVRTNSLSSSYIDHPRNTSMNSMSTSLMSFSGSGGSVCDEQIADMEMELNGDLLAALVLPSLGRAQTDDLIFELFSSHPESSDDDRHDGHGHGHGHGHDGVVIRTKSNDLICQMFSMKSMSSISSSAATSSSSATDFNSVRITGSGFESDSNFYYNSAASSGISTFSTQSDDTLNVPEDPVQTLINKRASRLQAIKRYQEKKKNRQLYKPSKSDRKSVVAGGKLRVKGRFVKNGSTGYVSIDKVSTEQQLVNATVTGDNSNSISNIRPDDNSISNSGPTSDLSMLMLDPAALLLPLMERRPTELMFDLFMSCYPEIEEGAGEAGTGAGAALGLSLPPPPPSLLRPPLSDNTNNFSQQDLMVFQIIFDAAGKTSRRI